MGKQTALFENHTARGALIVDFSGWQMPLHYSSQMEEHHQVRKSCGMFDVSHMAVVDIEGQESEAFLHYLLANNVSKLKEPGQALYGCMLDESGGIIDDLITYFLASNHYRMVVNAGTTEKDLKWFHQQAKNYSVTIQHRSDLAMIAVQGPKARDIAAKSFESDEANIVQSLKPFRCAQTDNWFIARTGYTGEDGIEVILPASDAMACWQGLSQKGVQAIGLGARDTLRLEAGLNLYGSDMDESVTPLESNLAWTVGLEPVERSFIGREALMSQQHKGVKSNLTGIVLKDKGVLRRGQKVYTIDDQQEVGMITSGTFSPTLKKAIGLARVNTPVLQDYAVEIRGKRHQVRVVSPPFVKKGEPTFSF